MCLDRGNNLEVTCKLISNVSDLQILSHLAEKAVIGLNIR